jgi:hypothetical protein
MVPNSIALAAKLKHAEQIALDETILSKHQVLRQTFLDKQNLTLTNIIRVTRKLNKNLQEYLKM